ncbi:MAG: hypothetical protein ACOY0T_27165 [Myxococcota bacterium]
MREPLEERLWPVMARGLRELLNKLAEEDGTLVSGVSDPEASLVEALAPRSEERGLVQLAVTLLVRERFLEADASSIWIPGLPASQAARWMPSDVEQPNESARAPSSSTERVRRHRANKRAAVSDPSSSSRALAVSEPVTSSVSPAVSGVTSAVSCNVSSSRGEREPDPSQTPNREKYKQTDHLHLPRAREATSVSGVTASVSSAVSRTVSPARVSSSNEEEEDDRRKLNLGVGGTPQLELPIQQRAALVLERPHLGRSLHPEQWPEVQSIASALAEATGAANGYLGGYDDDPGVQAVLKLYAAGIPQTALEYVARTVPRQAWWSLNGKKLGLSSLSLEVVRRNLPGADGRARVTNPGVAKALELLRRDLEAANE